MTKTRTLSAIQLLLAAAEWPKAQRFPQIVACRKGELLKILVGTEEIGAGAERFQNAVSHVANSDFVAPIAFFSIGIRFAPAPVSRPFT